MIINVLGKLNSYKGCIVLNELPKVGPIHKD